MNCLHCSSPIIRGRADRKFCSIDCKNEYHNANKVREHAEIKKISHILKKNRRILKTLCDGKNETVSTRTEMLKRGFNFSYFTHTTGDSNHAQIILCFDYGYIPGSDAIKVVKFPAGNPDA